MSNEEVSAQKTCVIGMNQTVRAIKRGIVSEVLLANDADVCIIDNVVSVASHYNIPITRVSSKKELGGTFGIEVGAATVGKLVN
ncbi:MAG: ribosomal L7Ae/L30e/S12e/Gadd45 family protein [Bacilli bacterium]